MNIISKLTALWRAESSKIAKIITNAGVVIVAVSSAVLGLSSVLPSEESKWIPDIYKIYSGHGIVIGTVIATISKLTKKDDKGKGEV
jgi:ABC-type Fe3+ transport system permease subunit